MDVRRMLAPMGAGALAVAVILVGTPTAATAAPAAPKGLTVARATNDVHRIQMSWKPVVDVDHYVVDIVAGDVQTVINVPSSTTAYTIDAPDVCTSFKMRVGAADAGGATTNTGYTFVKSLTPSSVMGMVTGREEEGTVAAATWRLPSWTGFTPLTGYHVVFTRMADGVVLSDSVTSEQAFRFPDIDPARAYTLAVTPVNGYGECWTAKSLVDRFRPAEPTGLVVQRRADAPGTVEVLWRAPGVGPAPTHYMLGYGQSKVTTSVRVDAATPSATLSLDTTKSWSVELRSYNVNGGSNAVSGFVPIFEAVPGTPVAAPAPTPSAPGSTPAPVASPTTTGAPGAPDAEFSTEPATTTTIVDAGPDRTAPTITTTLSLAPYNGWFKTPVTIHFTCADNSGKLSSCPSDIRVGTDGMGQRFSGTAVDAAGNTATITLPVTVDQVPPSIAAAVVGTKNAHGWYTAAPTVQFTCSDTVSGVSTLKSCPPSTPVTVDGVEEKVTGTALDKAGNTATATVLVSLDRVAPTVTATVVGDMNSDGWYTTTPTVRFTCADAVSGIAECPADRKVTTDGVDQQVSGTALDRAGHAATATVTLNVDRSAPTITATVIGEPNAAGWHRAAPTVRFTCADEGSGVADCPADVTVDADGADRPVSGTVRDVAGNTATATVAVSVDRTAPRITATVAGDRNADGWFRTAPTVHFSCSDEAGVAGCPEDTVVGTDGAAQSVTGTAVDVAGNTATASVTVDVDRVAPQVTATVDGAKNAAGWYRSAPTVVYTCTDAHSGVDTCPAATVVGGEGADVRVPGTATDRAGNTTVSTVGVDIDLTAPTVAVAGAVDGTVYGADAVPSVSCVTTDRGSGVATEATMTRTQTFGGGQTATCAGGTDRAGNAASPVTVSYSVKPTVVWLSALTHRYMAGVNPAILRDLDATLAKRNYALFAVKIVAHSLGKKPALTCSEAVTLIYWTSFL